MDRRSSYVLLAVLGAGVFLAGLELMITAVALPSILTDLVATDGTTAWAGLRKASRIVNGYLLVYVLVMPLAGRLTDLWGARRLFLGALAIFTIGSALAGAAQDLDQLIVARLVQAVGGGILVPVGTAGAAHLFGGDGRARALGVIGALTFLGMAAGPFLGAAILGTVHPEDALIGAGLGGTVLMDLLTPAWRWIFYVNVPIGIVAMTLAWAAAPDWETPRRPGRVDVPGAILFGVALAAGLLALTLLGLEGIAGTDIDPAIVTAVLASLSVAATFAAIVRALRSDDPFLDVRLFRSVPFSSAALVSAMTGYAFATAIIGGAVFVDRVLYGGPDEQRLALGALAGATALGALASGFLVRRAGFRLVTLVGLVLAIVGLLAMARWTTDTDVQAVAGGLALFGFGFGMSVTPRSAAAVEAAGSRAFGAASSVVTVARMIGMAVGLAILTAYGSTTIDRLTLQITASPEAYLEVIPEELRDRPLRDPLVVEALEAWASREAASIMVGLFLVAAAVTVAAVPPGLALGVERNGARRGLRRRVCCPVMAQRSPTSSSERTTGRSGEPVSRRRPPTSSGAPGRIRVAVLDASGLLESEPTSEAPIEALLGDPETTLWVDLIAPSPGQVEAVGHTLGLHPLVVEDILEGNQRPKVEVTDGVIHIVLFAMSDGRTAVNEVDIVLGLGFLLTVHGVDWDPRASHHLRSGLGPIMARGSDHLLWAICDDIVDGYFPFVDRIGDAIDSIQDAVLDGATKETLDALFLVKRELIEVRRSTGPTREVFNQLTNRDLELIDPQEIVYFRDVYDHAIRLAEELDNDRELAASTLDVYLTQVNNGLSVIMKRLTGVTVILAGIGAVGGIFGMSEAATVIGDGEPIGFWVVTGVTLAIAAVAALVLRRIDWI